MLHPYKGSMGRWAAHLVVCVERVALRAALVQHHTESPHV